MVSPFNIPISKSHMDEMRQFITAILTLTHLPSYPGITEVDSPIVGFDFYLTDTGPKLIEINTNPAALLLGFLLDAYHNHQGNPAVMTQLKQAFKSIMDAKAASLIVILDETPLLQHTYFEFMWFKSLFEQWGYDCLILTPEELTLSNESCLMSPDGREVHVIYNRYCDFLLEEARSSHLNAAYTAGTVQLLPSPAHYRLLSDKLRLIDWSNPDFLSQFSLSPSDVACIQRVIPPVFWVSTDRVDYAWEHRKSLFFKPAHGYGSRGVYRGKSISRPAFERLIKQPTIAQPFFVAPTYSTQYEGQDLTFKYDVRVYVVNGEIVLSSARLFIGQVTNLQTPLGGFASTTTLLA